MAFPVGTVLMNAFRFISMAQQPMGKEQRCSPAQPVESDSRALGLMDEALEFHPHRRLLPALDVEQHPGTIRVNTKSPATRRRSQE